MRLKRHSIIMGKGRKSQSTYASLESESKVAPILEMGFGDPLFSLATHPTKPILISGLATGHLFCHSYDPQRLTERLASKRQDFKRTERKDIRISQLKEKWWSVVNRHDEPEEDSGVSIAWKTKRHKGSCRSLLFDAREGQVGELLYSVGTDHIIKKATTETGKVTSKMNISPHYGDVADAITTMALSNTHPFLVTGTENGHVLVFDADHLDEKKLKFKVHQAHEDSINKILPMPAVSAYHFLSLGSTTLAHIDIRKGVITQSDDQADELLSMCYPNDFMDRGKNDTAVVSHGEGIVSIWKNSANAFSDQLSRIKVNKNASIDAMIATMNAGDDELKDCIWCGDSEGLLHRFNYKSGKVRESRVHSASMSKLGGIDEVNGLDIDFEYRLVSSGMDGLRIWSDEPNDDLEEASDSDSDSESDSDAILDSDLDSGSDSDVRNDSGSSSAESSGDEEESSQEKEADLKSKNLESSPDDTQTETDTIPQLKRKRRSLESMKKKPKKGLINLNKSSNSSMEEDEKPAVPKKTPKVKAKSKNNGIMRFDGL